MTLGVNPCSCIFFFLDLSLAFLMMHDLLITGNFVANVAVTPNADLFKQFPIIVWVLT